MFDFLSVEILIALGGVIATVISYLAGSRNAKHKHRADQTEADNKAILKRKELEDEVEKLDPVDRRKRLDRWVREGK